MPRYSWAKGQSGNPAGRPLGASTAHAKEWFRRLRVAAHRKVKIGEDGKPVLEKYKRNEKIDVLTVAADKVMELACEGNMGAVEHVANRLDGKVKEQVDVFPSANIKVRYQSYEEVCAALMEEGIDADQLLILEEMCPPKGRERN